MAELKLPTTPRKPLKETPRTVLLYGKPKCGKSTLMAELSRQKNALVIDCENGYDNLEAMVVNAKSYKDLLAIKDEIVKQEHKYDYLVIDNLSRLEDWAKPLAMKIYTQTAMGKDYGVKKKNGVVQKDKDGNPIRDWTLDVTSLPNGAGYLYQRKALDEIFHLFDGLATKTTILIGHVKEKQINKNGEDISELNVSVTGKAGDLLCSTVDAIGLIFRDSNKTKISFIGGENSLREARTPYLSGKEFVVCEKVDDKFKFSLDEVFR